MLSDLEVSNQRPNDNTSTKLEYLCTSNCTTMYHIAHYTSRRHPIMLAAQLIATGNNVAIIVREAVVRHISEGFTTTITNKKIVLTIQMDVSYHISQVCSRSFSCYNWIHIYNRASQMPLLLHPDLQCRSPQSYLRLANCSVRYGI